MASVKLTNTIRDDILRDMLIHRFRAEADALVFAYADLAEAVYSDLFTPAERKLRDSLPEGWLPSCNHIAVRFGSLRDNYESLNFSGRRHGTIASLSSDVPAVWRRLPNILEHGCAKAYDNDHAMTETYEDLDRRRREFEKSVAAAEKSGKAALYSASTIARLKVLWPEVAPFCAAYNDDDRVNLPALPIAALNAAFGLPVEEAA